MLKNVNPTTKENRDIGTNVLCLYLSGKNVLCNATNLLKNKFNYVIKIIYNLANQNIKAEKEEG